jgi:O-antigen/teichoic acid export membrane protein
MFEKYQKSEFTRNVFTLTSGTAIAQAIPVLLSPVLSRLYSPEDFGILALFMSVAAVLSVIATGRYELAIMIPENKKDAYNVLALSLLISFISGFLALILVLLFRKPAIIFFDEPKIGPWLYLIPVVVLFAGIYQSFNYWSTRQKTFKVNAVSRVSQSATNAITSLSLGIVNVGPVGLIAGYIIGQVFAGLVLVINFLKEAKEFFSLVTLADMKANAYKYRSFLQINTPHAFIDSLQDNGIVYVIMYFFSKMILGSYAFAYRLLKLPVGLIGGSIYQVFYQKASELVAKGEDIRPMILKIYKRLFVWGLPFFLILFIFTPAIFGFIFGENYRTSGEIARLLIPWIFINFIVSPVSCVALIKNKQKQAMYFTFADITFKVTSIIIGGIFKNYFLAFVIMSALGSLLLGYACYWYYQIAGTKDTYS